MKILIAYPPLNNEKGCPTLGQNRQFQYFNEPTYIYPVVPAQAATLLKKNGFEVIWLDCLAENINYDKFIELISVEKPDLVAFETKTPVVKQLWKIVDDIYLLATGNRRPATILFGDHVTALPEESFKNSKVDYVLTGGDYDFLLLSLCKFLDRRPATGDRKTELEPGIYYREANEVRNTGKFLLDHDLDVLPFIDRELTKWQAYASKNGNYKRIPGTYIMSGRDCWWGKCTFCSWPTLYPKFRTRSVTNVINEISKLIADYKIREIMDDTGCFSKGDWLHEFCKEVIKQDINKKIYLDCNMRFGALNYEEFLLMKKANFRLILFGLESANQSTLDRLNKGLKVERVIEDCKMARSAGLFPHITIMFGYPWESLEEAKNTLKLGQWLLKKGFAYTMQATMVIPYPGTPLFNECKAQGLLLSQDWDDYDMRLPIMKTPFEGNKLLELVSSMYNISLSGEFILRKIFSIQDIDDLKYLLRAAKKVSGHLMDFKHSKSSCSCKCK